MRDYNPKLWCEFERELGFAYEFVFYKSLNFTQGCVNLTESGKAKQFWGGLQEKHVLVCDLWASLSYQALFLPHFA